MFTGSACPPCVAADLAFDAALASEVSRAGAPVFEDAEVKSMRTAPGRTRTGVASRLLAHIIDAARPAGYTRLSLETGSAAFFAPARALYRKFGFEPCEPFGDYRPDPHSVFMTRTL